MKKYIITIAVTAVSVFLLMRTCSKKVETKDNNATLIHAVKQTFIKQKEKFLKKKDSLNKKIDSTSTQIAILTTKYNQTKKTLNNLLAKNTNTLAADEKLDNCDSIKKEAHLYIVQSDSVIESLNAQVNFKSEMILSDQIFIKNQDSTIMRLFSITDDQQKQIEKLEKKNKRKTTWNKVLKTGLIITTSYILISETIKK